MNSSNQSVSLKVCFDHSIQQVKQTGEEQYVLCNPVPEVVKMVSCVKLLEEQVDVDILTKHSYEPLLMLWFRIK